MLSYKIRKYLVAFSERNCRWNSRSSDAGLSIVGQIVRCVKNEKEHADKKKTDELGKHDGA